MQSKRVHRLHRVHFGRTSPSTSFILAFLKTVSYHLRFELQCNPWWRRSIFFLVGVTATAPSRDLTDNKKKRGERAQAEEKAKGSCSRRPRTKERKPGKRKKNQVEYRVEGAQDRRRRGGWHVAPTSSSTAG